MQIKEINDIPKWFDLKKYKDLAALDLDGWSTQVSIRSYLYWLLTVHLPKLVSVNESPDDVEDRLETEERVKAWIKAITKSPIVVREEVGHSCSKPSHDTFSVKAMSAFRAYDIWRALSDDDRGEWHALKEAGDAVDVGKETKEQMELLDTPLEMIEKKRGCTDHDSIFAVIDLSANDEQIINDFCQWLPSYRRAGQSHECRCRKQTKFWLTIKGLPKDCSQSLDLCSFLSFWMAHGDGKQIATGGRIRIDHGPEASRQGRT